MAQRSISEFVGASPQGRGYFPQPLWEGSVSDFGPATPIADAADRPGRLSEHTYTDLFHYLSNS